jgi:endonuclease YncB( thermonuclease family)
MIMGMILAALTVPAGQSFKCTPIRVWDGDGPIWCAEGPRVRLSGIATREMDRTCKAGHPCPNRDPIQSRDALVRLIGQQIGIAREGHVLVRGPTMTCRSAGSAGGNRTAAFCFSPKSGDLSCAMVKSGNAAKWQRYWRAHRC